MIALITIICLILLAVIFVQIGKVTELGSRLRGEEDSQVSTNNVQGMLCLIFLVFFLIFVVYVSAYYKNWILWYGPHESASAHGGTLDSMFNVTTVICAIVFFLTHIALFWFAYKFKGQPGRKALFMPHDNKLEIIWTAIPAVVMTFLVIGGLDAWNEVMADVGPDEEVIEIEATGVQFNWLLRYPGPDGKLGTRNFRDIDGTNPLGQVWTDTKNLDDIHPSEIVLPKGKKVRVRITARDVLHNFDLPHFRVKMDAVPGIPTYFVFTPILTTEEYRQNLKEYPEYNVPYDAEDPEGPMLWEAFNYELACAELCGKGHYSMKRIVRIVEQEEYDVWLSKQESWYMQSIRGKDNDPYKDDVLDFEINQRSRAFDADLEAARAAEDAAGRTLVLDYVTFNTGSSTLSDRSKFQLDDLTRAMKKYPTMTCEVAGHTDNDGDPANNRALSEARATSVRNYLIGQGVDVNRMSAKGYGDIAPRETNDTAEGKAKNRRTEFKLITN